MRLIEIECFNFEGEKVTRYINVDSILYITDESGETEIRFSGHTVRTALSIQDLFTEMEPQAWL